MDAAVGNKTGAAALGTEGTVFAGAPISGALTLLTLASIMYCSVYTYTHIYKGYTNVVSVVSALGFYWLFFCGWGRIQRGLRHAWQRVCTPLSTCGAGWRRHRPLAGKGAVSPAPFAYPRRPVRTAHFRPGFSFVGVRVELTGRWLRPAQTCDAFLPEKRPAARRGPIGGEGGRWALRHQPTRHRQPGTAVFEPDV